jgi:hypothetical protein
MQEIIVSFAKENLIPLAYAVAWYVLAGFIAALFGRKSRIDAWCEANPGLALVLNFLRATGFDMWKILAALKTLAEAKSKIPPPAGTAFLLVALAASGMQVGCSKATIDQKIDSALIFEDQAMNQVSYLQSVFETLVANPAIPADKQAEYRAKFAEGHKLVVMAFDAKDQALREARAANAETIDINALVKGIVDAVQNIIEIVAAVGASPLFIQEQHTKAMGLARGI